MEKHQRFVLIGMKSAGKTTVGKALAERLAIPFTDSDAEVEELYRLQTGKIRPFREIFREIGREKFRQLEINALTSFGERFSQRGSVLSVSGGLPLIDGVGETLRALGNVILLTVDEDVLLPRITAAGIPAFFPYPDAPQKSLRELLATRSPIYRRCADFTVHCANQTPIQIVEHILRAVELGEQ